MAGQNMKVTSKMISKLSCLNIRKEGFGLLHLSNGEKYTGSFVEDQVHGYGAFTK